MKTFRNTNFTKRDSECTNIVACRAEVAPGEAWIECDESELDGLQMLYIISGTAYYGWL